MQIPKMSSTQDIGDGLFYLKEIDITVLKETIRSKVIRKHQ